MNARTTSLNLWGERIDCPHCKEYRQRGDRFCAYCGNILDCPECDQNRFLNAAYCGNCGRRLIPNYIYEPEQNKRSSTSWIGIFGALFTIIFLFFSAVALYYHAADILGYLAVSIGILVVVLVAWLAMRSAPLVSRFLGITGLDALTRIMGFILICIAFQFVFDGLGGYFSSERFLQPIIENLKLMINQ